MSVLTEEANPCLACTVNQDCCTRLTGLMLTEKEYQRCFAHHGEKVEVTRDGAFYIINESKPAKCPNWQDEGCSVYDERPFECRLFPHNSYVRGETANKVSIRYHEVHTCPLVHSLKMKDDEARNLVDDFARGVYGDKVEVEVTAESFGDKSKRKWEHLLGKLQRGFAKVFG